MVLGLSWSSQFPGLQGIELSLCGALEEEPTMKSLSYSESNPWPPKGFHLLSHCPQSGPVFERAWTWHPTTTMGMVRIQTFTFTGSTVCQALGNVLCVIYFI